MIIKMIPGHTRILGKSQGYHGLPVKDHNIYDKAVGGDCAAMSTAWEPTPEELEKLNNGGVVVLTLLGVAHPPVNITVEDRNDGTELPHT